jgi:hypothetical protein
MFTQQLIPTFSLNMYNDNVTRNLVASVARSGELRCLQLGNPENIGRIFHQPRKGSGV